MQPKKILIVTRGFHPQNSPRANRATELAKELARGGHDVTVCTHVAGEQEDLSKIYGIRFLPLGGPRWREVPILIHGRRSILLRGIRRALLIFCNYPEIELTFRVPRALREKRESFDCAISIAAPHAIHWGMAWSAIRDRKPAKIWIADCGDPFMGQENDSFSPAFYFRWFEKAFCRYADRITVPTEGAKDGYYEEFRPKIHVIPQGFRFSEYGYLRNLEPKNDGIRRFAYAGLLIPGRRDPRQFLDLLLTKSCRYEFHIYSKSLDLVLPYAERDSRVIPHAFKPRELVMREMAVMDFVVNIENAGGRQTPSKLIDYWLCGRPILNINSHSLNATVIDEFLEGNYSQAYSIDNPEQYNIENVALEFLRLADELPSADDEITSKKSTECP